MRIRQLSIKNFRGIQSLQWSIADQSLICLIGRGDSTKSTVLEAIRRLFHPQWNLAFDDSDFFQCSATNDVRIEAVVGQLPTDFTTISSYGMKLQGWDTKTLALQDDPDDDAEEVLCVRLSVNEQLEPSWRVVKGAGDDGVAFKVTDRAKAHVSLVGTSSDRDLTWARGSLLSRLTDGESIPASLADAGRAARSALDGQRAKVLAKFDDVAGKAERTAKQLGVRVVASYKSDLDADGLNIRLGGLALHDGSIPLRQLGLGSKRMLTTGLHKEGVKEPHITLLDEAELGLEPQRIARLLKHLDDDRTGQYFITTHSPVVLRELTVNNLFIVRAQAGQTTVTSAAKSGFAASVQGRMRSHAESFLAPRIVVCEGATEVGFLRAWDDYWADQGKSSLAYQGVALLDARGAKNIESIANDLRALGYDVGVLADADSPTNFGPAAIANLKNMGVDVFSWSEDLCIESRVFLDVPWSGVLKSIDVAAEFEARGRLLAQVQTAWGKKLDAETGTWTDSRELRLAIGKAANGGEWFKRQDKGHRWGAAIVPYMNESTAAKTDLTSKMSGLRGWIDQG